MYIAARNERSIGDDGEMGIQIADPKQLQELSESPRVKMDAQVGLLENCARNKIRNM